MGVVVVAQLALGRMVASDNSDPWFKTSLRQDLY